MIIQFYFWGYNPCTHNGCETQKLIPLKVSFLFEVDSSKLSPPTLSESTFRTWFDYFPTCDRKKRMTAEINLMFLTILTSFCLRFDFNFSYFSLRCNKESVNVREDLSAVLFLKVLKELYAAKNHSVMLTARRT